MEDESEADADGAGAPADTTAAPVTPSDILARAHVHPDDGDPATGNADDGPPADGPETRLNDPSDREKLRNQGLEQFYGMRLTWSRWLIGWVTALIAFQIILAGAVGTGALDFTGQETFINLTVGQNFVQVVAMAIIVVRFLHSHGKDDPPL